jgi:hypothetical protein
MKVSMIKEIAQENSLEAVSKPHLTLNNGVAVLFKMLTYSHVCCAFSSACALFLSAIRGFETTSRDRGQMPIEKLLNVSIGKISLFVKKNK